MAAAERALPVEAVEALRLGRRGALAVRGDRRFLRHDRRGLGRDGRCGVGAEAEVAQALEVGTVEAAWLREKAALVEQRLNPGEWWRLARLLP